MFKRGDLVFAKVKGHSPWPAKILKKDSPTQFKVFFFGTKQEGVVKETQVWDYEEYVETFSSRYGSRRLYALALEQASKVEMKTKAKAKEKQKEAYETKQLVFAKVRGYSPWPAQILGKHAPKIYNVFFFGTSQIGKVKKENIWNYDAKREEFAAKYGKKKLYALALKQIGEIASLAKSKSTKENAPTSSETVTAGKALEEAVAKVPSTSDLNRNATEEDATVMLVDDEVDELIPTVSNMNLKDDEDVGKPIPMFEEEMLGLKESNVKVEMGNPLRMLRDRNQYEIIPELSRKNSVKDKFKKNRNIKKGSAEENTIKNKNFNNNDKECTEEFNPQKVVLKNLEAEKLDECKNEYPVAKLNIRTNEKNVNETEEIEEIRRNDLVIKITKFSITTTFSAAYSCSR